MSRHLRQGQLRGISAHVSDRHVWAEIDYLDSSTGYCEHLPSCGVQVVHTEEKVVGDKGSTWLLGVLIHGFVACLALSICAALILWGWWEYSRSISNPHLRSTLARPFGSPH